MNTYWTPEDDKLVDDYLRFACSGIFSPESLAECKELYEKIYYRCRDVGMQPPRRFFQLAVYGVYADLPEEEEEDNEDENWDPWNPRD